MLAVRDRLEDFGEGVEIALVMFSSGARLKHYRRTNELPFTMLADPERTAYRAFGLGRGSVARVWGPRALRRYVEIIRSSGAAGLRGPVEDTLQLGGDFVIAPNGSLAWGHWGAGPDDRPGVDELIAAVATAR